MKNEILIKIRNKYANVLVFGLGQIGLPIAAVIAEKGFNVLGVDINSELIETISSCKFRTIESKLNNTVSKVVKTGFLKVTSNGSSAVKQADIVVICVPTPIDKDYKPNLSYIYDVCKTISKNMKSGTLIIIESSLPPKCTTSFIVPLLEEKSLLKCGSDFWIAYCPERLTPGKSIKEFNEKTKIVGGYDVDSTEIALEFFNAIIKARIIPTNTTTAEVVKLAENTFRDVNIAYANELALICEELGVDASHVIKLANTHPRVFIHRPGLGVGGPCLPKDPYLLLFPIESKEFESMIITASRLINDNMPLHVMDLVLRGFNDTDKNIRHARIAVLGVTYKPNVNVTKISPSKILIKKLKDIGAIVTVYDPFCREGFGALVEDSIEEAIKNTDCIVIAVAHNEFKHLNLLKIKEIMQSQPIIIDAPRIINGIQAENCGFKYYGVGFLRIKNRSKKTYAYAKKIG